MFIALLIPLLSPVLQAPGVLAVGNGIAGDSVDGIRVISDDTDVNFPESIVFNLEVEGGEDIEEVTLYYRIYPSGIWSYVYPKVAPSQYIRTTFNLYTSGIDYIPPGVGLEYYYSIRDSQGKVLETRAETLQYIDSRFQWRAADAGPLTIFWHDLPDSRVKDATQQVEESLYIISDILHVGLETPLRGIIYNSMSEAGPALPQLSRTATREQLFQGFAFSSHGLFIGVGMSPDLIVHESAHLIMEQVTGSPRAMVPAWVDEGFASYVEPGSYGSGVGSRADAAPNVMPLVHMHAIPGRSEDIRYFYRKAESVVGYLLETYGPSGFRAFLGHLNDGRDTETALQASYGFGLTGLDQRWSSALEERGSSGGGDGPSFAHLNNMLLGLLVLAAIVILVAAYVVRRLRLRMRRDGPDDWDDGLTEDEWARRP